MPKMTRYFRAWATVVTIVLLGAAASQAAPTSRPAHTADMDVTPVPRVPQRHQQILASLKDLNPDIAFLGDSITEGWLGAGKDVWSSYDKYHAANLGVGGDATQHALWRITTGGELDVIKPKVIIIMIGTNNVGPHADDKPEWAAAGVKKIIDTIQAKLPDTKILLLAVFPRNAPDSRQRTAVTALNALIKPFADGDKIVYLDIGSVFLDADGNISKDIMKDGLHPTAKGYILWRDAMQKTLDDMLK